MFNQFLTFIKSHEMLQVGDRVLLAVSGGVDSMVLASLFLESKIDFGLAHVNYHLRGEDSNQDQELVENWCRKHEIAFHLREVSPEEYEIGESIQMVARTIRYDFFASLKTDMGYSKIATAHNSNDNLETVFLNLTKGTGIFGLTGIAPILNDHIVRPMLFASKEEIYEYARSQKINWREDVSNTKNHYQRNRIRNVVIPELKKINPNLEDTFQDTLDRIKGVAAITESEVSRHTIDDQGTHQELKVDWIKRDFISLTILSELLKPFAVSYKTTKDIQEAVLNSSVGALFVTSSHRVNVDRKKLIISGLTDTNDHYYLTDKVGEQAIASKRLCWKKLPGNILPKEIARNEAYFDLDQIKWPLVVRQWMEGDIFQPFGMMGKKKVSDFMIDSKIPVTLKQQVLILESGSEIMWLIGYRTDDRFKVTPETKSMLKIELLSNV